jgi:predicted dehydrogenase
VTDGPRIGFIGCGSIARAHLTNLAELGLAQAWAYADARPEAAEAYLEQFGGSYATDDMDRLLADRQIDAVVIATPDKLHVEHALKAIAAGKHLFLEKPMATSVSDALRLARAAAGSDRKFMVDFKFRFAPSAVAARRFVPRPLMLFGQSVGDPEPPGHWRLDPALSLGPVYDLGPHLYDLLYWLAGEAEPVRVYAEGGALQRPGSPLVDNLVTTFQYASGARATSIIGNSGQSGFASKWLVESFGGDRNATIHDHAQAVTLRLAGGEIVPADLPEGRSTRGDLKIALESFLRALAEDRAPPVGAADGVRVTRMIEAAFESAATGRPVELAPAAV